MRGPAVRRVVAVVVVAVLSACTVGGDPTTQAPAPTPSPSASPTPAPGDRLAVVVGPTPAAPPGELAALRSSTAALADLEDVAEVRVVDADTLAFAYDLAMLLADDGYDLVCVVGTGTAERLRRVAVARPATRFCGTDPTVVEPPSNLVVVGVDRAAVATLAAAALGVVDGPVAVLSTPGTGDAESLVAPVAEVLPPLPAPPQQDDASPTPTPTPRPSPSPPPVRAVVSPATAEAAVRAVEGLLDDGAAAIVTLTARVDGEVAATAAGEGVPVVGLADWLVDAEGELPPGVLAAVAVDRGRVLVAAVRAARTTPGAPVGLLGIDDGVLRVVPGTMAGADAAAARAAALLPTDG